MYDKVGVINKNYEEVIEPIYDEIKSFGKCNPGSLFNSDGLAFFNKSGVSGIISHQGKIIYETNTFISYIKVTKTMIYIEGTKTIILDKNWRELTSGNYKFTYEKGDYYIIYEVDQGEKYLIHKSGKIMRINKIHYVERYMITKYNNIYTLLDENCEILEINDNVSSLEEFISNIYDKHERNLIWGEKCKIDLVELNKFLKEARGK